MIDHPESVEQGKTLNKNDIKTAMEISSFVGDMGIKILPGKDWGVHYKNPQRREEILNSVLNGQLSPSQVNINELQPSGISYRLEDVKTVGLNGMIGKVREQAILYQHFDYHGLLEYLSELQNHDIDIETATRLFNSFGKTRVQSELLRTLGATGKNQLKDSLKHDASKAMEKNDAGKMQSLIDLMRSRWLEKQGIIDPKAVATFENKTGAEIVDLANNLRDSYLNYVKTGNTNAKKQLADEIKANFPKIQKQVKADNVDDFVEEMMKNYNQLPEENQQEIDDAFNDFEAPPNDVPSDFSDDFSPSMDEMKENGEKEKVTPLYSVEPPIKGLYQGPIYSHFDTAQVKWKMNHTMQQVQSVSAPSNHIMNGKIAANSTIPVYLPRNYAPAQIPNNLELLKDENETYYLKNNTSGEQSYEIAFGKQNFANTNTPQTSETSDMSSGGLSLATKNCLNKLTGKNNTQKAQAIIHYMKNVLKLKYSNDSKFNRIYKMNPLKYFSKIEEHKEVDCDVAQTYFIALCRNAKIPSRIVTGHSVDLIQDGKAILHNGTGHAWTEIWDEQSALWKTIDATPEKENDEESNEEKQDQDQNQDPNNQQDTNAPTEDTDIQAPPKEQQDDTPSPEQVEKSVDDQVEQTQQEQDEQDEQGNQETSSPPDSAKQKMEQMMDEQSEQSKSNDEDKIDDQEWGNIEKEMEEMKEKHEEMTQKSEELKQKAQEAESLEDLQNLEQEIKDSELYDDVEEKLEEMLEAKEEQAKNKLKDEIEKMLKDGFIEEEDANKLLDELKNDKMEDYSKIEKQLEYESSLYNEYENIREEILPLVDEWFEFFVERLPKLDDVGYDEDVQTQRGRFDRRSIGKPRNLLFGTTQNPLIMSKSTAPRFMASIVLDISGSMDSRMKDSRKLLIFFSELFDKISEEFGYIKFSLSAFDTVVEVIKDFDQKYNSSTRYDFGEGEKTIKVRLMETTMARGGTDMGKAVWEANKKLNNEKIEHPDYLSALYTISDGETGGELSGNSLTQFIDGQKEFWGEWWGEHMKCGFMLGPESQKEVLAKYFGEENAESVPDLQDLIEKVMTRFDEDVQEFIDDLPEE